MPPRRSTRSRTSVEPQPAPTTSAPSKRKRAVSHATEEPTSDADEKENRVKVAAKPRRVSSRRSSTIPAAEKGSGGTQSNEILDEVKEEDEEEAEVPRPAKKSRPSLDPEEEAEARPAARSNGRRSAAAKKSKAALEEDEEMVPDGNDDEEDDAEFQPKAKPKGRPSRAPPKPRIAASSKGQSRSGTRSRATSQAIKAEPLVSGTDKAGSEGEPSDVEVYQPKARSKPAPEKPKAKSKAATSSSADEAMKSDDVPQASMEAPDTHVEEEERSLLDDVHKAPSMPRSQPILVPEESTGPKSRLVIYKIALVNFKSYAGRQEIGPFHKSFSAIVGPNGSGKSNTIDALLFVFGYRASKMRQGKLSELIHNSAGYPDLDHCSVEVHFREIIDMPGPDAYEIVPKSSLVVARTAHTSNTSTYTINGKMSNLKEVTTLLKGRGIDLDHKRFLILQGEVESIALMKPKAPNEHEDGLLEYLEDIIGTSKYKEPIQEAMQSMDQLADERAEKLNRLRIVEREKDKLEQEKKEAVEFLKMQNEHVRAKSRLWQWYLWKCLSNEEEYNKQIARLERELEALDEKNRDDLEHFEQLEAHYAERERTYDEVREAAAAAVQDLKLNEKKEIGLEERRKHANSKVKSLTKALKKDEDVKAEAERTIEDSTEAMERQQQKLEDFETSLAREEKVLEEITDGLKDRTQIFHDQIEAKQKELAPWTQKRSKKEQEKKLAENERDELNEKTEAAKAKLEEAETMCKELNSDQHVKVAESDKLQREKTSNSQQLKDLERRLEEARRKCRELQGKSVSSRQRAEEARASQSQAKSQGKVLDMLNTLKKKGQVEGFHGRLGNLGTIPDKYDVAITTACGALNNLVVDTVDQGQYCIEQLRKGNVGRASFIVLEKLDKKRHLEKPATPENVPRLFDLITPKEPRFAPAFYKAISDTLVANDLDQANRIAYGGAKRWRVVTLGGQLIDVSGTMAGGGAQVSRGGMSSKFAAESVSPQEIVELERVSQEASQTFAAAQSQLRQIDAEYEQLSMNGPQVDLALEKLAMDIQTGKKRISEADRRVQILKSQCKPDAADVSRISALVKAISAADADLAKLKAGSATIEQGIQELEKKILDIGGSKLIAQRSKLDGIRLNINLTTEALTKAEVAIGGAQKTIEKMDRSIAKNETELEAAETDLKGLVEELQEVTAYVTEIRSKVEDAQAAAENSKDDLENLRAELDKQCQRLQAFRKKKLELGNKLSDTKKEADKNGDAIEHWSAQHETLKLEDIDDDDDDEAEEHVESNATDGTQGAVVKPEPDADPVVKPDPDAQGRPRRDNSPENELHTYASEELRHFTRDQLIADEQLLDEKIKNAKPNLSVLKEYRKRNEEFLRRADDLNKTTAERDKQKAQYDGLRKQRLDEFMAGFNLISLKLKEMYQMITLGGNAELELVDSMDPFSEGIIFSVMPPKKSWKNIANLSGGEKTLSSLALVFALHVFKPTPLYFMDEIDAALDFRNVSIVANYIKDRTKNAQFIIISLRNDMFELSHRLIGIYKTSNTTKSISIDNHALAARPINAVAA